MAFSFVGPGSIPSLRFDAVKVAQKRACDMRRRCVPEVNLIMVNCLLRRTTTGNRLCEHHSQLRAPISRDVGCCGELGVTLNLLLSTQLLHTHQPRTQRLGLRLHHTSARACHTADSANDRLGADNSASWWWPCGLTRCPCGLWLLGEPGRRAAKPTIARGRRLATLLPRGPVVLGHQRTRSTP